MEKNLERRSVFVIIWLYPSIGLDLYLLRKRYSGCFTSFQMDIILSMVFLLYSSSRWGTWIVNFPILIISEHWYRSYYILFIGLVTHTMSCVYLSDLTIFLGEIIHWSPFFSIWQFFYLFYSSLPFLPNLRSATHCVVLKKEVQL